MVRRRQFREPDPNHKSRSEPSTLGHVFCREPFAPATLSRLRQIRKRAFIDLERAEQFEDLGSRLRYESVAHSSDTNQIVAIVVSDGDRIETARAGNVAADDKLPTPIYSQLDPSPRALAAFVDRIRPLGDETLQTQSNEPAPSARADSRLGSRKGVSDQIGDS